MSLSKKSVADLAQQIRESRVTAFAYAKGDGDSIYPYLVGALQATIAHMVQQQGHDSTEVSAAFEYQPSDDEMREYLAERDKWRADYEARKAAASTAGGAA